MTAASEITLDNAAKMRLPVRFLEGVLSLAREISQPSFHEYVGRLQAIYELAYLKE